VSNRGFKGISVGITSVKISGSTAEVRLQFVNPETGDTHGLMTHHVPLAGEGVPKEVTSAAQNLLDALVNHLTQFHFTEPEVGKPIEEASRGISESLRGESDEPA
jgi:hypothetical protein